LRIKICNVAVATPQRLAWQACGVYLHTGFQPADPPIIAGSCGLTSSCMKPGPEEFVKSKQIRPTGISKKG